MRGLFVYVSLILMALAARDASAEVVRLSGKQVTFTIDPATLAASALKPEGDIVSLAAPADAAFDVRDLKSDGSSASWNAGDIQVSVTLDANDALLVTFHADKPSTFAWPRTQIASDARIVLPTFEGLSIPAADAQWRKLLIGRDPLNTLADLSMPFWGVQSRAHTATFILTEPFNSEIAFTGEPLAVEHHHEFTRNNSKKTFGVRITLDGPSPIASALSYRSYLMQTNQFVSLQEKIKVLPDTAKLIGASHAYLWGDATISRHDVRDFKSLIAKLVNASQSNDDSLGKRIWAAADKETTTLMNEQASKDYVDDYTRRMVASALSAYIDGATDVVQAKNDVHDAYASMLNPVVTWGDGVSPKMIGLLHDAGLKRLWLGVPDYASLQKHPDAAQAAIDAGYLIGPYDSYHSIHSPGEADTWDTAQFDQALYETGPIVRADGTKKPGFKKKGFNLSPLAAKPNVEQRVDSLLKQFHANSWFVDCDAFGEVFDDYSPLHPATQRDDMEARCARLRWLADAHKCVVGSEGGASFAAPVIAFAHGMMSPVIAWGDPDLYDRESKSPYALGRYYPPDGPAVFFKTSKLKDEHRREYFDPHFRVPLYQAALHDSLVTTHHWSSGSFKFDDPDGDRELLELLYNVPPLYHLNVAEWDKRKAAILKHAGFFSPLHEAAATIPLQAFEWLTPDHLVQRTKFGDVLTMVANFGDQEYTFEQSVIPPHAILAKQAEKSTIYRAK